MLSGEPVGSHSIVPAKCSPKTVLSQVRRPMMATKIVIGIALAHRWSPI